MKRTAYVAVVLIALLFASATPSQAWSGHRGHGHGHFRGSVVVGVGVGPWWGYPWEPYPYWWYPPPYPPYAYAPYAYAPYAYSPTVVMQDPPVYVQQQPASPPLAPPAPPTPQAYWYYCPSMKAYYPGVPTCSEPWVKVPPRTE